MRKQAAISHFQCFNENEDMPPSATVEDSVLSPELSTGHAIVVELPAGDGVGERPAVDELKAVLV